MDRKEAMIGVGVAVVLALLVLFMKGKGGQTTGGNTSSGAVDVTGGFQTAGTVYVPTTAETYNYNTYKGAVSYSTVNSNETTTYSAPGTPSPVIPAPQPVVQAHPIINTTATQTINHPTSQTGTKPAHPAPVAKSPAPAAVNPSWYGALHGGVHYATPRGGWNPNSIVDNLKSHNYSATFADQQRLAASMGIKNYTGSAAQNIQMLNKLKAAGK